MVASVTPSHEFGLFPYRVTQTFLANELVDRYDWGQVATGVDAAHALGATGRGVKIGIADTGVDRGHATDGDLKRAVAKGRNFTRDGGRDNYWDHPSDGHGTHVAGVCAARRGQGPIIGVAPEADLYIGRCLFRGVGDHQGIADTLLWFLDEGVDIANLSLGSRFPSEVLARAIEKCVAAGMFIVAAAGNSGGSGIDYPARWSGSHPRPNLNTLAISSVMKDGEGNWRLSPFSSFGPEVTCAAPGSDITSTWINLGHATISGTSMATPHISGGLALLKQLHRDAGGGRTPLVTMQDAADHLTRGAAHPGKPGVGRGIVMLDQALKPAEDEQPDQAEPGEWRLGPITVHVPARGGDLISISRS